jgi:O-acetyl-ADP-ribose deacetylase (regulator of RNase III)
MKRVEVGDILTVTKGIIVHGCNAQGVMGSGIAKQIRDKYPMAYEVYRKEHETNGLLLGEVIWAQVTDDLIIGNAITQQNYGRDPTVKYVSYKAIQQAFETVMVAACTLKKDVHYPMIGAGLANGNWAVISEIIDDQFIHYGDEHVNRTFWVHD